MAKNVLIADRGRRGDPTVVYTLLDEVGKSSEKPPFTIFGVSSREEDEAEARGRGAYGLTSDPQELFESVTSAILKANGWLSGGNL